MSRVLIAFFSYTGNTRTVAELIYKNTGGNLSEIEPVDAYPADYSQVFDKAKKEINSGCKPALRTKITNIKGYSFIFLGYPNWWSTIPAPVTAFLNENDLSGKIIAPFCTHGSGGLAATTDAVKKLCPESKVLTPLGIRNNNVKAAENKILQWLSGIEVANNYKPGWLCRSLFHE